MKILLTGKPKIGKSTIINLFRKQYEGAMAGIVTDTITNSNGIREGFLAESMSGEKKLFAHISEIKSDFKIGKFYVDIDTIDSFFINELDKAISANESLILIDEIGRMQSLSHKFLAKTKTLINSPINILGSIVYDDEEWSLEFKNHPEIILIKITKQNRNALPDLLVLIFTQTPLLNRLNVRQKKLVMSLLKEYLKNNSFIQIKKLIKNAVPYTINNKISKLKTSYLITGNAKKHKVTISNEHFSCDCDLFNGKGRYENDKGICSHILTVKLFNLS